MKSVLILATFLLNLSSQASVLDMPPETSLAEATAIGSCVLTLQRDIQIKKNALYANENGMRTIIAMKNVDPDHVRRLRSGRQIIVYRAYDKFDLSGSTILYVEDEAVHSIKIKAATLRDLNAEGIFSIECLDSIPLDV